MIKEKVSLLELPLFAKKVSDLLLEKKRILLEGEIGVGKTTFAKYILQALNPEIAYVQSPSFPIMIPYDSSYGTIWHIDFYRLSPQEILKKIPSWGFDEMLANDLMIIEWSKNFPTPLDGSSIQIQFLQNDDLYRGYFIL